MPDPAAETSAELVWTRQRPTPRRHAPSVEQIVAQAILIADTQGLAALSMRRVAADLQSGTASLYRYVTSRDELLDLMIDTVRGEDEPPVPSGAWRADLAAIARQLRGAVLRHPWMAAEITGRPALGPNLMRQVDAALGAAGALTADITLASSIVDAMQAYVLGAVAIELAAIQAQQRTGLTEEQWQATLAPYIRTIVASGKYPQLARRIVEAEDLAPEVKFEFGLACFLDGIAARAQAQVDA